MTCFFLSLSYSLFQRVRFSTHNTQQDCTTISSLDCVTFAETLSRYLSWEVYSLYRHRFNTRRFLFIFRFLCYLRKKNLIDLPGRAVRLQTSDGDTGKLSTLAGLAVQAGFDWVHYATNSYIHASVIRDGEP